MAQLICPIGVAQNEKHDHSPMINLRTVLEIRYLLKNPEMKIPAKRAVLHESPDSAVGARTPLTLTVFSLFSFGPTARVFQNHNIL